MNKPIAKREAALEARFAQQVKNQGGMSRKFVSPGHRGVPDRLVIWPGNHIHFVELKTEMGDLSPQQTLEQERLRDFGCQVFTLHGGAEVNSYLNAIKNGGV